MHSARKLPEANIVCKRTLNKLEDKHNTVEPEDSAISEKTAASLLTTNAAFNAAMAGTIAAEKSRSIAKEAVDTDRVLLHNNITVFFGSLNGAILLKLIPNAARAYYGLDTGNKNLPDINTDEKMTEWANRIVTGDAERVADGGFVINVPSKTSFIAAFAKNKASLNALTIAVSAVSKAQTAVNDLRPAVDKLIKHAWNEVENNFSDLLAPALRAASRPWSVRYASNGDPLNITGKCTDSETGLAVSDVTLHLEGIANKVLNDISGNFILGTTQYGDMDLIAVAKDYHEAVISITLENGVDIVVNIVMTRL